MLRLIGIAAACLPFVLSWSSTAQSAAMSSARIDNIVFQLFDLDPADGIDASITFLEGPTISVEASAWDGYDFGQLNRSSAQGQFALPSITASGWHSSARAGVTGNGIGLGGSLYARGETAGTLAADTIGVYGANVVFNNFILLPFTLSARTLLLVRGVATVESTTTIGKDLRGADENAWALAWLSLGTRSSSQQSSDSRSADAFHTSEWICDDPVRQCRLAYGPAHERIADALIGASMVNLGNEGMEGFFQASAGVRGNSQIVVVPEPENRVLIPLALIALLWRMRRIRWRDRNTAKRMTKGEVRVRLITGTPPGADRPS